MEIQVDPKSIETFPCDECGTVSHGPWTQIQWAAGSTSHVGPCCRAKFAFGEYEDAPWVGVPVRNDGVPIVSH